jgi:large subunit ribosomal protein L3
MTSQSSKPRKAILGRKLGMTQVFEEDGRWVPVTVIEAGPCTVLQVKTEAKDGYPAVQLGFADRRKSAKWPQQAYLEKIGVSSKAFVREVPRVDAADLLPSGEGEAPAAKGGREKEEQAAEDGGGNGAEAGEAGGAEEGGEAAGGQEIKPGARIGAGVFRGVTFVDVRGVTKGRGFQGVIRRYRFNAGPKSHGSKNIREPGSTGMHTDPARVLPGKRMPGHMGAVNRKMRNLRVVRLDEEQNLLIVKGSVPGPRGGYLYIEESLEQS